MSSPVKPADFKAVVSNPNTPLCGNFINTLLKLPTIVYQLVNWMLDSSGNLTNAFKQQIIPPGDYRFSGSPLAEDAYWLFCDGREVLRADYPDLFAAIGVTYGTPSTGTVFKLPDFRARAPACVGNLPTTNTPTSLGQKYGQENVTLDAANMPAHNHQLFVGASDGSASGRKECLQTVEDGHASTTGMYLLTSDATPGSPDYVKKVGGDNNGDAVAHDNLGPRIGVYVYIKT